MRNFNINRFCNVTKRLVVVRWRNILNLFLGFGIFFLLYALMAGRFFAWEPMDDATLKLALSGGFAMVISAMGVGAVISGSFIISDLNDYQSRVNELMLPATNLEKYLARLLLVMIGFPLIIFCAFLVADGLQQVLSMLVHHGGRASMLPLLFAPVTEMSSLKSVWDTVGLILVSNAFLVLCGMFYRKTAWLKGFLTMIAFCILIVSCLALYAYLIEKYTDYEVYISESFDTGVGAYLLDVLLIALPYYLGYRIYCRLLVINNRWRNV